MSKEAVIIHRLTKPTPSSPCQSQLRDTPITVSGTVSELCKEIRNTYLRKAGKQYGSLSADSAQAPIKPLLLEYMEGKISFVRFTEAVVGQIKLHMDTVEAALDQHLLFFFESIEAGEALYIIMLDHAHGHCVDGELELSDSRYLDTQNFNLAAKIKISDMLENQQQNYLSICRWRGEKDISDAFIEAMGFCNKVDVVADTSQFLELVTHYTKDLPDQEAFQTREQVVDYCLQQDKSGEDISVEDLSQHLPHDDREPFAKFVSTAQPHVTKPFIADKTQLRNYVRISGRNEKLSMSFASACLGESVTYDAETDTLTIRDIPSSLKSKLMQHLKTSSQS